MKSASSPTPERLRILVLGYIIRCPIGGMSWHYLQYVLGLHRLGHEVYFLEDSEDYEACYDPERHVTDKNPSYGLRYASHFLERFGLGERWAYHDAHTSTWQGPCAARMPSLCKHADLLLNISGSNPLRPWLREVPVRAFIDTDPLFEQVRQCTVPERRLLADGHTVFFTFGGNVGREGCDVPSAGREWIATRQPVVLDAWPVRPAPAEGALTTVMQWDSYKERCYGGRTYGMKSAAFVPYMDLPSRVDGTIELALGSPGAPRDELRERGWRLADPLAVTRDPWTYQRYIQGSKGEFSVAKHGYVASRCGWFSERSAAYLASGRPVVVQETGFSDWLRADGGVLPFNTPEEAVAAVESVNSRYAEHCRAAREVAVEYFDAAKVLTRLIEAALRGGNRALTAGIRHGEG